MLTSVIGYPRVGGLRELKFASEKYFRGEISFQELTDTAKGLRKAHWEKMRDNHVDFIPCNDFSFYDNLLDTAVLFHIVPKRYEELGLSPIDEYFAMARGYQGEKGDVKALAMKKWFDTNYHYMVPELEDETKIYLAGSKPFDEYLEAKSLGVETKVVISGAFTLLKLVKFTGKKCPRCVLADVVKAYSEFLAKCAALGVKWVQFDEPYLVYDLTKEDIDLFKTLYNGILPSKGETKVLLQTYFGDVRDCYNDIVSLDFNGVGLDFVEGKQTLSLVKENGFPKGKLLFAGLVNGKNIWKNNYEKTVQTVEELKKHADVVLSTSCSLLHVPYTLKNETSLSKECVDRFAFAEEKLSELNELSLICEGKGKKALERNKALFATPRGGKDEEVLKKTAAIRPEDAIRLPSKAEREKIQKEEFRLPLYPTTTIGSFPQTQDVKTARARWKRGELSTEDYEAYMKKKISECVALQEEIRLDVIVHGEYERGDMVEYFGESLKGFVFTEKAWVQSYGTRCVKPPIVWGDISREKPITVKWSVYAQSLTKKPVKGMLTGPVTILNWSFPREDVSVKESTLQIALAIREEVLDLEANGIRVIQIDEAALREKLPLRKSDWNQDYLDWAIPAFRLVHSGVKAETQIHTHMCYSEFTDIIPAIDNMDADVITFEASRSDLQILSSLKENNFTTEVGPGVYDIHSPRVPSVEEIVTALKKMREKIEVEKLWVNPDCGLKTRGTEETVASLKNMVAAAKQMREAK